MRVIDYYNIGAFALLTLVVIYALSGSRSGVVSGEKRAVLPLSVQSLTSIVLGAGLFVRIVLLESLPYGLQQDEASIGYEAFCLANYGIDRHGYAWPVYPITWGSGGGSPLMIYLNVLSSRIFGSNVASVRFVPCLLGVLTLTLMYKVLQRTHGKRTALAGLALLAFCPWHIILSRWSLDSNTMPFFQIWMILLLLNGAMASRRRLPWYIAGCVMAAVCLYDYGSATVVIPLFLVLYVAVLFYRHRITIKEAILSALAFVVVCLPIGYFYGVQYLGFPEINWSWISFNRFTASHASAFVSFDASLPRALLTNLVDIIRVLTIGVENEDRWNAMPEYAALYKYMLPFLIIGLIVAVRSSLTRQENDSDNTTVSNHTEPTGVQAAVASATQDNASDQNDAPRSAAGNTASRLDALWKGAGTPDHTPDTERAATDIFLCMFVAAALFGLVINVDINRMVMIFLPAIYLETLGLRWLIRALRRCHAGLALSLATAGILIVGFASFAKDYYGGYYNDYASNVFMPGYGKAMAFANWVAEEYAPADAGTDAPEVKVYSTYSDVASPFMITLFYTQYDPYEFMNTAVWRDLGSEFQIATAFGRFVFGLPDDAGSDAYTNDIFVVTGSETELFSADDYEFVTYGNFTVALPKELIY